MTPKLTRLPARSGPHNTGVLTALACLYIFFHYRNFRVQLQEKKCFPYEYLPHDSGGNDMHTRRYKLNPELDIYALWIYVVSPTIIFTAVFRMRKREMECAGG